LPAEWRISYRHGLWVTVGVGVVLSLALLAVGLRSDAGRAKVRDDAARVAASSALRTQIDALDGQVLDLAGLLEASHMVEPDEFQAFVRPMLQRSKASALVFLRDVTEAQRPAFERERGGPILEIAPNGSLRTAGRRDRYIVVVRAAYALTGRELTGVDVLPDPVRRAAMDKAQRAGALAATGAVALARNGERGLIVFTPVRTDRGSSSRSPRPPP
jgi:CHASE1-domain containing sensor protein